MPSNGTGADGDYYLNTSTNDVYTRASGSYSLTGNIGPAVGTSISTSTGTGSVLSITNSNTATASNRSALTVIAGNPNGNGTVTYATPPTNSGITSTFYAAMANATSGSVVGSYGWANTQSGVPFWGHNASTGGTNWSVGLLGTSTGPNGRAIMGQATGAPTNGKLATGVYGEATSDQAASNTTGRSAGVTGTVSASTGSNYGVYGLIPSTGSSSAAGVRGENLNTTGGVGVSAYTAASSGRAIVSYGSVMIDNRSASGSATSASDGLIVWSNSGASGFNASGALFTPSDRNVKNTFTAIDETSVLNKLAALPITKWHYRNDDKTWYMGPMAQDFMASFGLGDKDTVIHTVNADGVALAAIKGLNTKVEDKTKTLEARLNELEARVVILESALTWSQKIATGNLGVGMSLIGVPVVACRLIRRRRS